MPEIGVKSYIKFFGSIPTHSFLSVVVITCASHAQGRRFEPGRKQNYFFVQISYLPHDRPDMISAKYDIWTQKTKLTLYIL